MDETLPITIVASDDLTKRYKKLTSVANKQAAHINFQTLAAGWYEDENKITKIEVILVSSNEYLQELSLDKDKDRTDISDDVTLYSGVTQLTCLIAITEAEMNLLDKEPKVLSGYVSMKLKKVINVIAKKKGLMVLR